MSSADRSITSLAARGVSRSSVVESRQKLPSSSAKQTSSTRNVYADAEVLKLRNMSEPVNSETKRRRSFPFFLYNSERATKFTDVIGIARLSVQR